MPSALAAALLLLALPREQPARGSFVRTRAPPIDDHFAGDWLAEANVALVYSRNFNRQREFAYAACEPSHCNVTLVLAEAARARSKTCEILVSQVSASGSSGISSLHVPDGPGRSERLALVWWRRLGRALGAFVNSVNMSSCRTSGAFAAGRAPRVLLYRHPVYSSVAAEADYRVVATHTFSGGRVRSVRHVGIGHRWTGEEQPVERGPASRGFFVLGGGERGPLSVMYANVTGGWKWLMAEVPDLGDPARTYPKSSGAHQKYGLCWKRLGRDDRVSCAQFLPDGRRAVGEVGLRLPEAADWLAVHNLAEPALLLVSAQCHAGACYRFRVAKLHADGRLSAAFDVKTLDAECPAAPRDLSMDVVEDLDGRLVCFHFVCLNKFEEEYSFDRPNTVLQYRRNCIKRADMDRMFE